ncbi:MAG: hypothetical protein Q8M16_02720 [Pirellulaceae bacterium]|nr:hypothetical protein [Pirellulaceae bacterium]
MTNTKCYCVTVCVCVVICQGCDRPSIQVSDEIQQSTHEDPFVKDLGDVSFDSKQPVFAEFVVHNNEIVPMNVRIISTSCGCVSAGINGDSAATIRSGEFALLKVSIQPENMYIANYTQSVTSRVKFDSDSLADYDKTYSITANILPRLAIIRPGSLPLISDDTGQSTLDLVSYRESRTPVSELGFSYDPDVFAVKSTLTGSICVGNYIRDSFFVNISIKDLKLFEPTSGIEICRSDSSLFIDIRSKSCEFEIRPTSIFFNRNNGKQKKVIRLSSKCGLTLNRAEYDVSLISVLVKQDETGRDFLEIENLDSVDNPFSTTIQLFCRDYEHSVGKIVVSSF